MSTQGKKKNKPKKDKKHKEHPEFHCDGPKTELANAVWICAETQDYILLDQFLENDDLDLNEKDSQGLTALHFAVFKEDMKCIRLLIAKGASCNIKDQFGFTPLFYATGRFPNVRVAEFLITEGKASVYAVTETGVSPLHGAALLGNIECMKVLLDHGADPRCEDEENHSPLDIAANEETRKVLHKVLRKQDRERDEMGKTCAECGKSSDDPSVPESGLKRCSQCHVTLYCSRECQVTHWKQGGHKQDCCSFVLGYPDQSLGFYTATISHKKRTIFSQAPGDPHQSAFLRKKQFIVKVQIPLSSGFGGLEADGIDMSGNMMVYNEDRTVKGFIPSAAKGYRTLHKRIQQQGVMGIKGYFWAELDTSQDAMEGSFKVFHGNTAPVQSW